MTATLQLDVAIFGGGIAGLWSLARLRQAGYAVALFETGALGGVQSIASQGIIHGGTKYALGGRLGGTAQAIAGMPARWRACLAGGGELDLSAVRVLSPHQYLWSTGGVGSGLAGFFAGRLMRSRMTRVASGAAPPPFDHPAFQGQLYRLEEPVLDTASLMGALAARWGEHCHAYPEEGLRPDPADPGRFHIGALSLSARRLLFAAGSGNAGLLARWGRQAPRMQTRPLHMLMLRGALPPLFAHCLGASANPRLTITSAARDGGQVWYLGGELAERGVGLAPEAQIAAGRRELAQVLPWVPLEGGRWSGLRVDRAEPMMPGARRPDDVFLQADGPLLTAWPTKLALAPRLADRVLEALAAAGVGPSGRAVPPLPLPRPPLARRPWEEARPWS